MFALADGAIIGQAPDLSEYATKDDLNQYSTTEQVTNLIQQSLSSYATTSQIDSLQSQINALDDGWELLTDWRSSDYNLGNNYNANYYYKIEGVINTSSSYDLSIASSVWIFSGIGTSQIYFNINNDSLLSVDTGIYHTIHIEDSQLLKAYRVFVHR